MFFWGHSYKHIKILILLHNDFLTNTFLCQDNVISTPEIKGTILPGITRKSMIDVARTQGFQVTSSPSLNSQHL